jgi:hypothetical protein
MIEAAASLSQASGGDEAGLCPAGADAGEGRVG